jgi:hypothetical protein
MLVCGRFLAVVSQGRSTNGQIGYAFSTQALAVASGKSGVSGCADCASGTHADTSGLARCVPCTAGTFMLPSTNGSYSISDCRNCPAGAKSHTRRKQDAEGRCCIESHLLCTCGLTPQDASAPMRVLPPRSRSAPRVNPARSPRSKAPVNARHAPRVSDETLAHVPACGASRRHSHVLMTIACVPRSVQATPRWLPLCSAICAARVDTLPARASPRAQHASPVSLHAHSVSRASCPSAMC